MTGATVADIVVIGIIVLSGLFALARGLVKEVLSIASWGGAVLVTLFGFIPMRPIARDIIEWQLAADLVTGAALFLGSLFIFSYLSHFVAKLVQGSAVGALDRSLGFLFGLARGLLIVVVLFLGLSWAIGPSDQPGWFRDARTAPFLATGARILISIVPAEMRRDMPRVIEPRPRPAPAPEPTTAPEKEGYGADERRDMQRLIEGTQ